MHRGRRSCFPIIPVPPIPVEKKTGVGLKPSQLLLNRELHGNVITSLKGRCNFQEEYLKIQASKPEVWKYYSEVGCDVALQQLHVDVQTQDGLNDTDILLGGSSDGSLSVFEAKTIENFRGYGAFGSGLFVWPPHNRMRRDPSKAPARLWRRACTPINSASNMSCMKLSKGHPDGLPSIHHAIVTSLGSEASGGSLYTLNLAEPFCFADEDTLSTKLHEVTQFNCTVWDADISSNGTQAVVGTDIGAALIDLETRLLSWVLGCRSDVLSIELDQSGNNVLCGLRNGAIVTIDARQKSERLSTRIIDYDIPFPAHGSSKLSNSYTNRRFEFKGDISNCQVIFMPSSISCLEYLRLYDQYFLASSIDGSIRLYDQRLIQRGPVQSYQGYQGNVNSHTRIGLGIDPYEKIVMSGGEDLNLRMWSIKPGQLLFEHKFMKHVPTAVCWSKGPINNLNRSSEVWLGSRNAMIYHMHWPLLCFAISLNVTPRFCNVAWNLFSCIISIFWPALWMDQSDFMINGSSIEALCHEGNVNSHASIGLGIDPYEKIVVSGGEDLKLRMWSIESGQLLYEYVPSAVC